LNSLGLPPEYRYQAAIGTVWGVAMHVVTCALPIKWAFLAHMVWNVGMYASVPRGTFPIGASAAVGMLVAAARGKSRLAYGGGEWAQHVATHYTDPWNAKRERPTPFQGVFPFACKEAIVPKDTTPQFDPKPLDVTNVTVYGQLLLDDEEKARTAVFFLVPTSAVGRSPARSTANLLGMIKARIQVAPPMDPEDQFKAWITVSVNLGERYFSPIVWENHTEEWLAHFAGAKYIRAVGALNHLATMGLYLADKEVRSVSLMLKTDELLFQRDGALRDCLKPRALSNLSPILQARAGPEILEATRRLHAIWDWDMTTPARRAVSPYGPEGRVSWAIYIVFGSDATDKLLTEWWERVTLLPPCTVVILVAGDDVLVVVINPSGSIDITEADFTMFDQSQSTGPLRHEARALTYLGVTPEVTRLLLASAAAPYIAKDRDGYSLRILHAERPMRVTGGPNTTIGNSIVAADAWAEAMAVIVNQTTPPFDTASMTKQLGQLGFRIKIKAVPNINHATFLKGMWYPVGPRDMWGPLPSRILKVGKSLTDPRAIYRTRDLNAAGRLFLADMAHCYGQFVQVPLLAEFVAALGAACGQPTGRRIEQDAPWKVRAAYGRSPGKVTDESFVLLRYGFSEGDLEEMKEIVARATPFSFLSHPGFETLARVDYG